IGRFDQRADVVFGGERHRDQFLGRLDFALADQLERSLEFMGERRDLVEAEHRAGALDGMQRAEGRIDQLAVIRSLAEIQQRRFQRFEQLACFLTKDLCRVQRRHDRTSLLTTASSCSGLNGFVIHPVAPALLVYCLTASLDSVVRKTIGSPVNCGSLRSARINSRPFMFGMLRSVMTRSGRLDCAFARPCAPSPASMTLWPAGSRVTLTIWRMLGESSTVRTVAIRRHLSCQGRGDRSS